MSTPNPLDGALLLCLDMQPAFVRAVDDGEKVLYRCRFAVAAALGLGMRAAFTEQVPAKMGGTESRLLSLAASPSVHAKDTFSALAASSPVREALLGDGDVTHLVLCGVETPICVYQTAVDALKEGLAVTLLSDAVGARRPSDARTCLEALARAGAHVLPSETVFYSIVGGTAHPYFKAYTQLVKSYG